MHRYGSLLEVTTTSSYKIKLSNPATAVFTGVPVHLATTRLSLIAGWYWLPYLRQEALPIAGGLPTHLGGYAQGDVIKSFLRFALYYESYGWFGSLSTLTPGTGYMLNVANSGWAIFA